MCVGKLRVCERDCDGDGDSKFCWQALARCSAVWLCVVVNRVVLCGTPNPKDYSLCSELTAVMPDNIHSLSLLLTTDKTVPELNSLLSQEPEMAECCWLLDAF